MKISKEFKDFKDAEHGDLLKLTGYDGVNGIHFYVEVEYREDVDEMKGRLINYYTLFAAPIHKYINEYIRKEDGSINENEIINFLLSLIKTKTISKSDWIGEN